MAFKRNRPVAANIFDPQATATSYVVPEARAQAIEQLWQAYPGRRMGGSGATGLASNDAEGWRNMLREQQEYQSLQNFMGGKDPTLDTRFHGNPQSPFGALPSTYNPAFQSSALAGGSPVDGLRSAAPLLGSEQDREAGVGSQYQSHENWMLSNPSAQQAVKNRGFQRVANQRGSTGTNVSQRYQRPNPNA